MDGGGRVSCRRLGKSRDFYSRDDMDGGGFVLGARGCLRQQWQRSSRRWDCRSARRKDAGDQGSACWEREFMTFIAVRLSTADVATINHGCPSSSQIGSPPSHRGGVGEEFGGMDVEDGGDMSAWRATRRLPWKRGDQIHPARPSPFQILTSTTLDTTLTWSCRWCLHLCHLVQSQRIGNLGLPRTHVVCWDHVLGRRGGRRRCPSCCWRHSGPLFQRSSWFAWEWFVFTWALLHELQPPIPLSSGAIPGGRAAVSSLRTSRPTKDLRDRHRPRLSSLRACLPGPAVYDAERPQAPLVPETRYGRGACLTRMHCLSPPMSTVTTTKHWEARPRPPCRVPGTRTRSLLSRWLRKRAVAILCSAASNSLVRLCRSSPTVPFQNLFTRPWLRLGRVHLDSPWTGEWE